LLALALPREIGPEWLEPFARGLGEDAKFFSFPLLGGDTDCTPGPLTISVAAIGAVPHGKMVLRSGARPGDRVIVTGTIGDAALGVLLRRDPTMADQWGLRRSYQDHLKSRYLLPQPRNALIETLRAHATAAMDVSDGLVGDLAKLCRASGVAADVDACRVPLSDAARAARDKKPSLMETILTGGDDYEILATIPADAVSDFFDAALAANINVTEIGRIEAGEGIARFVNAHGEMLSFSRPSFSHF